MILSKMAKIHFPVFYRCNLLLYLIIIPSLFQPFDVNLEITVELIKGTVDNIIIFIMIIFQKRNSTKD